MKLPDDETGNSLKGLQEGGSDLSKSMKIDFFIAVPDEDVGVAIAAVVSGEGFEYSVERDDETGEWTCCATKVFIPSYANVVEVEKYLDTVAEDIGGRLDGFGSYGNA